MEIGSKIKQLRTQNGLTLEELASRCELTKGFLSQLERDLTSPSVSTLQDIVEALGTDMSTFFKTTKPEQVVFKEDDFFVDEKDGTTIHWIVPNAQKNEMEPILIQLEYGARSQLIEPFEGEEFGYVLKGSIEIVSENEEERLSVKKGETFYLRGNSSHYLYNKSKNIAEVLWVTTPPIF